SIAFARTMEARGVNIHPRSPQLMEMEMAGLRELIDAQAEQIAQLEKELSSLKGEGKSATH
ncbi:MAG: hypothetical protein AAF585_09355, partial [Verrucomicrobiota bacterium]